jgi:hypothetical protein
MMFKRLPLGTAEDLIASIIDMLGYKLPKPIDDRDGVFVALLLCLPPREQAVATEHDSVTAGIVLYCFAQLQCQFESWAPPGNPDESVPETTVELLHLLQSVGSRGQSDTPIRMQVVHVRKWKESMERGINRCRDGVVAERAKRIQ